MLHRKKIDLDGKTWLQNSISVWSDIKKSKEEIELKHPALFPVMLVERIISIYSHKGDIIFDPFAGVGSTLIAARNLDRQGFGIELSKEYINLFHLRVNKLSFFQENKYNSELINDDSNNLESYFDKNSIQLTVTSPPYWDILKQKRTADNKIIRNYGDSLKDLGNIKSYNKFIDSINQLVVPVASINSLLSKAISTLSIFTLSQLCPDIKIISSSVISPCEGSSI